MGSVLAFPAEQFVSATSFYTPADAARISRVPRRRLEGWRREGIIVPTMVAIDDEDREELGYTFESLVYLRLLRMLRDRRIPLVKAVGALKHLRDRFGPPGSPWSDARIFVQGTDVFVEGRDVWGVTAATRRGQKVASALFGKEFARLRHRADALLVPARYQQFVEIDPRVRSGLPVVRGTSVRTGLLYKLFQRHGAYKPVQNEYSRLSMKQIKAAVAFERLLDEVA